MLHSSLVAATLLGSVSPAVNASVENHVLEERQERLQETRVRKRDLRQHAADRHEFRDEAPASRRKREKRRTDPMEGFDD